MRRVVISGMGIVSSIGDSLDEVAASLKACKSGLTHDAEYESLGFKAQVVGRPKIDPEEVLDKKTRRFMGVGSAWNYIAMQEALETAKLSPDEISDPRLGMIMGSGGPSTRVVVEAAELTQKNKSPRRIGPFAVPKSMSSSHSAVLSVAFKIKGINYTISSACATSIHCIGAAYEQIQLGKQDMIFAGGGEELNWSMSNLFDAMGAMSTKYNDQPQTASRAYDRDRDGFVIAGGAAVVVVEELEHALARGAPIYGELLGYGANSDGFDMVAPSGEGAVRCMQLALSTTDREIDYINTHGTSTPVGDSKETGAIREVFGSKIPPFSSTKSLTGHSLGAVGAQETIFSLLMMRDNFLTASANIENIDPEFADLPIIRERVDNAKIDTFLTNSFGFGGTNGCLVVGRYKD
jgi:3-oxoacyl-[acyl-carrier-protein] synthase I